MSAPNEIAKKLMDIIPPSMNWIRTEMRSVMKEELSIPQFRIMASIFRGNNIACEIAKHQGISQAAMSKMIDSLVARGFVEREANELDRRHYHLNLTVDGDVFFKKMRRSAQTNLKDQICILEENDKADLEKGLLVLEKLFNLARSN